MIRDNARITVRVGAGSQVYSIFLLLLVTRTVFPMIASKNGNTLTVTVSPDVEVDGVVLEVVMTGIPSNSIPSR